jgi:hypothetical protein
VVVVPRPVDVRAGTIGLDAPKPATDAPHTDDPDQGLGSLEELTTGAQPLFTVGATAAVAVDVRGGVHAVSGATGKVVSAARTGEGFGKPVTESVGLSGA